MELFARLAKVHEEERVIHARALCEEVDRSREVVDYAAARAAFERWSEEMRTASGGKSLGNIRVMHQPRVAGRVIDITYLDDERAIDVAIKVDDDQIWQMCKAGAYTGLSIGGAYAKKWDDPDQPGVKRYEPKISELSIVDRPCVPSATFQVLKADGAVEERHFAGEPEVDEGLIAVLKARVVQHNEAHDAPHQKAKLGDLKKVWEKGARGHGSVAERYIRGLRKVDERLAQLAKGAEPPRPRTFGELRKASSERGNTAGAYAGAAVTSAVYGYAGRKLGGLALSPVTATLMAGSNRFRRGINRANDAYIGFKTGVKRSFRSKSPGLIPGAIRHSVARGRALDATKPGIGRSVRGMMRVPGVIIGTGLAVHTFRKDLAARRAEKMDGGELQKGVANRAISRAANGAFGPFRATLADAPGAARSIKNIGRALSPKLQAHRAGKLLKPAGRAIAPRGPYGRPEAGLLAGAAVAGGAAAGAAAHRGNPYRDENGKFTSKDKAVLVVGTGATLGALVGAAGGVAFTRYGVRRMTQKAQDALFGSKGKLGSQPFADRLARAAADFESGRTLRVAQTVKGLIGEEAKRLRGQVATLDRMTPDLFEVRQMNGLNAPREVLSHAGAIEMAAKDRAADFEKLKTTVEAAERGIKSLKAQAKLSTDDEAILANFQKTLKSQKPLLTAETERRAKVVEDMAAYVTRMKKSLNTRINALDKLVDEVKGANGERVLESMWVQRQAVKSIKGKRLPPELSAFERSGAAKMFDAEVRSMAAAEAGATDRLTRLSQRQAGIVAQRQRALNEIQAGARDLYSYRIPAAIAPVGRQARQVLRGFTGEANQAARLMARAIRNPGKSGLLSRAMAGAKQKATAGFKRAFVVTNKSGKEVISPKRVGVAVATALAASQTVKIRDENGKPRFVMPKDLRWETSQNDRGEITVAFHYKDPRDPNTRRLATSLGFSGDDITDIKVGVPGTVWKGNNQGGQGKQIKVSNDQAQAITKFLDRTKNNQSSFFNDQDAEEYGVIFRRPDAGDDAMKKLGAQAGQAIVSALEAEANALRNKNNSKIPDADVFDLMAKANGGVEFEIGGGKKAQGSLLDVNQTAQVLLAVMPKSGEARNAAKEIAKAGGDKQKLAQLQRDHELTFVKLFENAPEPVSDADMKALNGAARVFARRRWISQQTSQDIITANFQRRAEAADKVPDAEDVPF